MTPTTTTETHKAPAYPRHPFGVADALCLVLLGLLLLVLALTTLVPALLGLTPYTVASDSMEPTLSRGDLIFIRPAELAELTEGNVIAFRYNGGVLTHRVWSVDLQAGTLRTRADAAPSLDPFTVTGQALLGRAVYKLPLLGYLNLWREETVS